MSRRSSATSSAAAVVVGVILFAAWRLWHTGDRRRRRSGNRNTSAVRFLLTASVQNSGKVISTSSTVLYIYLYKSMRCCVFASFVASFVACSDTHTKDPEGGSVQVGLACSCYFFKHRKGRTATLHLYLATALSVCGSKHKCRYKKIRLSVCACCSYSHTCSKQGPLRSLNEISRKKQQTYRRMELSRLYTALCTLCQQQHYFCHACATNRHYYLLKWLEFFRG